MCRCQWRIFSSSRSMARRVGRWQLKPMDGGENLAGVRRMIAISKLVADHLRHTRERPNLGGYARRDGSCFEDPGKFLFLLLTQCPLVSDAAFADQRLVAALFPLLAPASGRLTVNTPACGRLLTGLFPSRTYAQLSTCASQGRFGQRVPARPGTKHPHRSHSVTLMRKSQ